MASALPVVERTSRLPAPADEVYAWHERPGALERLLPPWERVQVVERHGGLEEGARTVLRVGVGPASVRWVAVHRDPEPGRQFVDEQESGPFSHWVHTHRLEPDGADTCRLTDRIAFTAPLGMAGAALETLVIRPRLERLLAYRHAVLRDDLTDHRRFADRPRLHVAIAGASGLIGRALRAFLTTGGHRVTPLVRRPAREGEIEWHPDEGRLAPEALRGIDAVVNLAGENIGARWTPARRRRIRESRVRGTRLIADTLARVENGPRVLVNVSAVGIYGDRGDEHLTERSHLGDADRDFLVALGEEWEGATEPARAAGVRVVRPRFGVVLTPAGGMLGRLWLPFVAGVGGRVGDGRQWLSWISIDDAIGIIHHLLMSEGISGVVNAAAPEPVTNREFTATLGRVLRRPTPVPVPAAALRMVFGEMADRTILGSQRVVPDRLPASGYRYRHPTLEAALRHVLGREG